MGDTTDYRSSGVSIEEGNRSIDLMKKSVRKTFTPRVLSDIGHFGGLFRADFPGLVEPVLVASTDGVGTKLKVASMTGSYGTVGMDLVNHCVNDILVQGAVPLFFMDYIACGRLDASIAAMIVEGLAAACSENGCALLGGETAEMPGFYSPGDYDVAGTIVGVVGHDAIIDGSAIRPGMSIIGLASNGLHTNGYSLARKVLFEMHGMTPEDVPAELGCSIGEALLKVHRSYLAQVRPLLDTGLLKGIAHITGGGIPGNLSRILPGGCGACLRADWDVPPIFSLIQDLAGIDGAEMAKAFNMGAGMLLVVEEEQAGQVLELLSGTGEIAFIAGEITSKGSIAYA